VASQMGEREGQSIEWAWSDAPIVLPVAFQSREWNAIYIAFYLAEYSGSKVIVTHVLEGEEEHAYAEQLKKEIDALAKELSVRYEYSNVEPRAKPPRVEEIARAIVDAADSCKAQAIVMSAHREGLFRELFGRVSDHVARFSGRRVVLVETPRVGMTIPRNPKRILIPVLEQYHPDPLVIAAALTSSASVPDVEITVAKIFELPPTLPLDAIDVSHALRKEERDFSYFTSLAIKALGRFFNPKIVSVRDVGDDLGSYVREQAIDVMVMFSRRETGYHGFLTNDEYDIVSKSPCIVLVTLAARDNGKRNS
jgi:nucleotide-binding universal stress UspA family protein